MGKVPRLAWRSRLYETFGGALRLKDVYQLRGCWRSKSGHFFTEEKSHPHYFCVYWEVVLLLVTEQTRPTVRRSDVFLVSLDVVQFSCIIMGGYCIVCVVLDIPLVPH